MNGAEGLQGIEHLTDMGNAQRLLARHGKDIRFCGGDWLVWDSRRFTRDDTGEVQRRACDTALSIYREVEPDMSPKAQEALLAHAKASESSGRIASMLLMAQSLPTLAVTPAALDSNPMLLNVGNGIVDLRTGKLREHSRADLCTKIINVNFDPSADCPVFEKFLSTIMDGNQMMVEFLQRAIGYSLTGDIREQCFFILHGTGSNGKSTFIETVLGLLGEYGKAADSALLLAKQGDGVRNDVAALAGSRFIATSETEAGRKLAESLVKGLTGGDSVTARFLYREFFTFQMQGKLWLSTNHRPHIKGTDHAIWRRVRLIPFTVTIPAHDQDRELPRKLRAELPGILRWAVEGCLVWRRDGLGIPIEVTEATDSYRQEQDTFGTFLGECCKIGLEFEVPTAHLRDRYAEWCAENGQKANPSELWAQLTDRGFHKGRDKRNRRRLGLRLLTQAEQEILEFQPANLPGKAGGSKNTVTTLSPFFFNDLEGAGTDTGQTTNYESNQPDDSDDSDDDSVPTHAKSQLNQHDDSDDSVCHTSLFTLGIPSSLNRDDLVVCHVHGNTAHWQRPDGSLVCDRCHPQPRENHNGGKQ